MTSNKRHHEDANQTSSTAPVAKKSKSKSTVDPDKELQDINALLQSEETSQKQAILETWQIGKRLKKLLDSVDPALTSSQSMDALFLWGTALSRLGTETEDDAMAAAAVDKFEEIARIAGQENDVDEALGPVGYSLWASSLLLIATEQQKRDVLDQALVKFKQAVEVDAGTTFETNFQFAKALKEGGDLVQHLEPDATSYRTYYEKALVVCKKLEEIYESEVNKETQSDKGSGSEAEDERDIVETEDYGEVKLLEAVVTAALETDASTKSDMNHTLSLYRQALEIQPQNGNVVMEMGSYISRKALEENAKLDQVDWTAIRQEIEDLHVKLLGEADFDMSHCQEICRRKDEVEEDEEVEEIVPHLLHSLGRTLAAFVRASKYKEGCEYTVQVLRSAHHYHDKLGCYPLATLYASIPDEEATQVWLATADSYGVLEDDFDEKDFPLVKEEPWFQKYLQEEELVALDDEEETKAE